MFLSLFQATQQTPMLAATVPTWLQAVTLLTPTALSILAAVKATKSNTRSKKTAARVDEHVKRAKASK